MVASVEYIRYLPERENPHILTAELVSNLLNSFPVSQSHSLEVLSAAPVKTRLVSSGQGENCQGK